MPSGQLHLDNDGGSFAWCKFCWNFDVIKPEEDRFAVDKRDSALAVIRMIRVEFADPSGRMPGWC